MSNLSSGPHPHHKLKQNPHHAHHSSGLAHQNTINHNNKGNNNHASNGPPPNVIKKNVRAWGNINPNNNNPSANTGTGQAWRNSSPAGASGMSPHVSNGHMVPPGSPAGGSHYNSHHHLHQTTTANDDKMVMKAMHDRMVWFIMSLVGLTVTATTKSGQRFQGLLSSAVTEAELCITLKRAVELPVASTSTLPNSNGSLPKYPPAVKSTLIILAKELVQVVAEDIDLQQASPIATGTPKPVGSGFKTDAETLAYKTDANGNPVIREKELKAWVPTSIDLASGSPSLHPASTSATGAPSEQELMNNLEDSLFPKGSDPNNAMNRRTFDKSWDQFEANEKLFGARTDFDEEIYTTKLDRTGKDFKERERKAELLAREIMASSSSNPHVQEERGLAVADDSGMNEEDKYGAVVRSEGAYVPPGARKGAAANRSSVQPPSTTKTAPSAPPLSHTSSTARPPLQTITENDTSSAGMPVNTSVPAPGQRPESKTPLPTSTSSVITPANSAKDSPTPRSVHSSLLPEQVLNSSNSTSQPSAANLGTRTTNKPSSNLKPVAPRPPSVPKPPDEVTPRFKAFMSDEKERLQQKKKDLLKKEKETKLAELRAFSRAFKLPTQLPKDLEPIIAKKPSNPTGVSSTKPTAKNETEQLSSQQQQQLADDVGRRASTTAATVQDKNHVRYLSKVLNPTNFHIAANVAPQPARTVNHSIPKPVANPNVVIGLKKLGPLAAIPPYKPNKDVAGTSTSGKPQATNDKQSKTPSRFANIAPIPPFKPKNVAPETNMSMVAKDLSLSSRTAAFNPSAKTFNPVPGQKASASGGATRKSGQVAEGAPVSPPNPFFGNKPIKKGSSSMHVKEEFTPFKNSTVVEACTVAPAWNFTGKSYRQLFGATSLSPHHHAHFMPHMMHHPAPHQQQQQHMHHHPHQHPQPHHVHPQGHYPQNMMMVPAMHMQHPQSHHPHHGHHGPAMGPPMMNEDEGMSVPMNGAGPNMLVGGNGVVVNGPNMMVGHGGVPGPGGHGYMTNKGPGMAQQQQQQQQQGHPHHLPPPMPPYMYHPPQQPGPPQQSPQSPYNGSYRHGHNGGGVGYGPPVPVGVNMGGPMPPNGYGAGPPVVGPGPGNGGGPYMGHMAGYNGSPILGPGPTNNPNGGGNGNGSNNPNANGPPHPYSPQMGGMPGHGPPNMYPHVQMFQGHTNNGGPTGMTGVPHGGGNGPSVTSGGPNGNVVAGNGGGRGNGGHQGPMYNYPGPPT